MANLTPALLQSFDPGSLIAAQNGWGTAGDGVASAGSGITGAQGAISGWLGPASMSARSALMDLNNLLQPVANALHDGQYATQVFIEGVLAAKEALNTAIGQAHAIPGTVDMTTGVVTPDPFTPSGLLGGDPLSPVISSGTSPEDPEVAAMVAEQNAQRQAAAKQAQTAIKAALQKAVSVDQNCAGELKDGTKAAGQAKSFNLAAPGPGGLPSLNLGSLANAPKQYAGEVQTAKTLAQQTSQGNAQAATQLVPYTYIFANDHTFATSVATALGQQGIVNLENDLGQAQVYDEENYNNVNSPEAIAAREAQVPLNTFLASMLASATSNLTSVSSPGSASQLSGAWVNQLIQTSSKATPFKQSGTEFNSGTPAYWSLGQILNAPNASTFSDGAMTMFGNALHAWDLHNQQTNTAENFSVQSWQEGGQTFSQSFDPLVGLMHAAQGKPAWAQTWLSQGSNVGDLLSRKWGDQGAGLGNTVLAASQAGVGTDPTGFANKFINAYGSVLENAQAGTGVAHVGTGGDDLSGLRQPIGLLLSQHVDEVNAAVAKSTQGAPANLVSPLGAADQNLSFVLEQVGKSEVGFQALFNQETKFLAGQQATKAQREAASTTLGYTWEAHKVGVAQLAKEGDFAFIQQQDEDNLFKKVIIQSGSSLASLIPVVSTPLTFLATVSQDLISNPTYETKAAQAYNTVAGQLQSQVYGPLGNLLDQGAFNSLTSSADGSLNAAGVGIYAPPLHGSPSS